MLKCHIFTLNNENNFISNTETGFFPYCLGTFGKKNNLEINKIFKDF